MIKLIGYILFSLFSINCFSQQNLSKQLIGVIDYHPFIIQADGLIFSFNSKDTFTVGPGRIRVMPFKLGTNILVDHLLHLNNPVLNGDLKISITGDNSNDRNLKNSFRKSLPLKSEYIETIMDFGSNLSVAWIDSNMRVVQKMVFKCKLYLPILEGYKNYPKTDSLDQVHKTKHIKRLKLLPIGFSKMNNSGIVLSIKENLDFKFQKPKLVIDSSLFYRLFSPIKSENIDWTKTGHLLTLTNLKANRHYFLEVKYQNQAESKNIEITSTKKLYQEHWFIITCFISMLVFVYFILKWYYRKKIAYLTIQRNRVEDKLKMLQSQLNPHFVFNALSSIEGLVTAGENELANQYLANFSLILRETLRNMDKILLSLEEELNLIDKYCKVEQLRFGFLYKIVIDDNINKTAIELPPLLLQPIVENAIKHGLAGLRKNGYLEIALNKKENNLEILIKNNRTNAYTNVPTAGGFGLKYLNQRILHFNQLNPDTPISYEFQLFDKEAISKINFQNCFL